MFWGDKKFKTQLIWIQHESIHDTDQAITLNLILIVVQYISISFGHQKKKKKCLKIQD